MSREFLDIQEEHSTLESAPTKLLGNDFNNVHWLRTPMWQGTAMLGNWQNCRKQTGRTVSICQTEHMTAIPSHPKHLATLIDSYFVNSVYIFIQITGTVKLAIHLMWMRESCPLCHCILTAEFPHSQNTLIKSRGVMYMYQVYTQNMVKSFRLQ